MSNATKIIILILSILLVLSGFVAFSSVRQKSVLEQSKTQLEGEVAQYKEKQTKLTRDAKNLEDQLRELKSRESKFQKEVNDLNGQITQLTVERNDWENKVDELKSARDELVAKLQSKEVELAVTLARDRSKPQETAVSASPEKTDEYWADVLKEKASLSLKLTSLQNDLTQTSLELDELKKKNFELETGLGQLKGEREDMQRKIRYSEDLANTLAVELAREKNDKKYVNEKIDRLKDESVNLRSQIRDLTTTKIALEKTIVKLSQEKAGVEQKLAETENVIQDRIEDVLNIKNTLQRGFSAGGTSAPVKEIELPPIIVNASPLAPSQSQNLQPLEKSDPEHAAVGFNGKIVSVDKENNFVVVNLGETSGIQAGDQLNAYRNSQYIGRLEVIEVRNDISAADIKEEIAAIEVGDTVR